jgi:hypothetical protein
MISKGSSVRYEIVKGEFVFGMVVRRDRRGMLATIKVTGMSEGIDVHFLKIGETWTVPEEKLQEFKKS